MIVYDKHDLLIRQSTLEDIIYLKDHLRASDVDEIMSSHGHGPEEALHYSMNKSIEQYTAVFKGRPVAMFGMCPDPNSRNAATVWMLTTDEVDDLCYRFFKVSKIVIKYMLERCELLYNFVDARNVKAIRWLEWCGAVMDGPKPYGVNNMPFRFFFIARQPNV